jgi:long-chain acyl-CoA synthetase
MKTLIDLFNKIPERGKQVAFVYRTGVRRFVYTYDQFFSLSKQMSVWLDNHDIKSGDRVLIWAPNSPCWAVSFWGCVLRGVIVIPVDFMSGRERAQKIAELTNAKLILQSQYKADRFETDNAFLIETLEYDLTGLDLNLDYAEIKPTDIVEIVYTSGTTGNPKGVILTHENLIANLIQVNQHIHLKEEWRFLSLLPLSHMFEQMGGFFTPLYIGGSITYLKTLKPSEIMKALKKENIHVVILVPRLLQALMNGIERELQSKYLLKAVNYLGGTVISWPRSIKKILFYSIAHAFGSNFQFFVSGGAALDREVSKFWKKLGFLVIEGYGITECSPILTANKPEFQKEGSVGSIIPDLELKLANNEIAVKGKNIFTGYYQNEQATKNAFTSDGFFKTGDHGYLDEQGNLFLKGRVKEMIVTGAGMNIYPDDIEPILNKISGIKESCIIGVNRGEGEEVYAVLILDGSGRKSEDIISEVNAKLDLAQQITSFSIWPELDFPKTSTLKVQKFKVKERLFLNTKSKSLLSSDKLITIIVQITHRSIEEINESTSLVGDLGLTSVARLELANALEQEFRLDMDDTVIKQQTTVAELREMVEKRKSISSNGKLRSCINNDFMRSIRKVIDIILHKTLFGHFVDLEIKGLSNLDSIKTPVFFVSNHTSYIDALAIWFALPSRFRYYLAVAAGDEFFFEVQGGFLKKLIRRMMYTYVSFFGNAFIIPEKTGFRHVVQFMGKLVDDNINILFFPEGGINRPGINLPYKLGAGVIIQELKIPVVPIKLSGLAEIIAPDSANVSKGKASVTFGQPILFTKEQSSDIVSIIEKSIKEL